MLESISRSIARLIKKLLTEFRYVACNLLRVHGIAVVLRFLSTVPPPTGLLLSTSCTHATVCYVLLILACCEVHIGDPPVRYVVVGVLTLELSICHGTILGGPQSECDSFLLVKLVQCTSLTEAPP